MDAAQPGRDPDEVKGWAIAGFTAAKVAEPRRALEVS